MALIKCPECGKEISNRAKSCPNCGCPIEQVLESKTVKIKMPNVNLSLLGLVSSRAATVIDKFDNVLWRGEHGQMAVFEVDGPTVVTIQLGAWANEVTGTVEPNKKYSCVQDRGIHWKETYRLTEVEVIDAE